MRAETKVGWAIESTWGIFSEPTYIMPVVEAEASEIQESIYDSSIRGVAACLDFASYRGLTHATASLGGEAYPELLGDLLYSTLGSRSSITGGYRYTLGASPPSLSIQVDDGEAGLTRLLGCYVEELTIVSGPHIMWNASLIGKELLYSDGPGSTGVAHWGSSEDDYEILWDGQARWAAADGESIIWSGGVKGVTQPLRGWSLDIAVDGEDVPATAFSISLNRPVSLYFSDSFGVPSQAVVSPLELTVELSALQDSMSAYYTGQHTLSIAVSSPTYTLHFYSGNVSFDEAPFDVDRSGIASLLTYYTRVLYNTSNYYFDLYMS